jgi:hypothetical protein
MDIKEGHMRVVWDRQAIAIPCKKICYKGGCGGDGMVGNVWLLVADAIVSSGLLSSFSIASIAAS